MALNKEEILEAEDTSEVREVEVEKWDDVVYVTEMSALERDKLEEDTYDIDVNSGDLRGLKMAGYRARVCALTLCDEDGEKIFDYKEWKKLAEKSADAIDTIFDEAADLNGLTPEDIEGTVNQ